MQKEYVIKVTQEDMDKAERSNSNSCAAAQAVMRTIPEARFVSVDIQTIRFTKDGKRFVYLTPPTAQAAIANFDAGIDIQPFTCRLRTPQVLEAGRAGSKRSRGPVLRKTANGSVHVDSIEGGTAPPRTTPAKQSKRRRFGARVLKQNQLGAWEPNV